MRPYRSVLPSRALTVNRCGGTQPAACSRDRSARATCATASPWLSRSTATGAVSTVEWMSRKYLPSFENRASWLASSGVSSCTSPPSRLAL